MKNILYLIVLVLLPNMSLFAQDFDLGDVMEEAQDFFGGAQQKAEYEADTEAQKKFEAAFKEKFKKWGTFSANLDNYSAETKCAYLIFKYKIEYDFLVAETIAAGNCTKKYDLYGMQLIAMMSSTSIMYCSESLFNLLSGPLPFKERIFTEEEEKAIAQLVGEITQIIESGVSNIYGNEAEPTDLEKTFMIIYGRWIEMDDSGRVVDHPNHTKDIINGITKVLESYFHPLALLNTTAAISQEMNKLKPCAYN